MVECGSSDVRRYLAIRCAQEGYGYQDYNHIKPLVLHILYLASQLNEHGLAVPQA